MACAAVWGCALSWSKVRSLVQVAPVTDGEPVTISVAYNPQLLMLTLLLATAAGVFAVVGTARLWRTHPDRDGAPGEVGADTAGAPASIP